MKPRILMDLDGTVLDFNKALGNHLRDLGMEIPEGFVPNHPYWDDDPFFDGKEKEVNDGFKSFVESGFHTEPYPGAVDFLQSLAEIYEIIYCTARTDPKALEGTYRDLVALEFPLSSIIFTKEKGKIAEGLDPLAAMEDAPHNIEDLKPVCPNILVPRRAYNSEPMIVGIDYIHSYKGALKLLKGLLE